MITLKLLPAKRSARFHLVLLHAFPLSSAMWDGVTRELQALRDDVAIHLVNSPGFGDAPTEVSWTMDSVARALRSKLMDLGIERIILGGISMGGYEAMAFYRQFPGLVRALVLSNTRADPDTEEAKVNREVFAADALARGPAAAIDRLLPNFITESTPADVAQSIQELMGVANPQAMAAALRAMGLRESSQDLLPLVTVPTLVITGSLDKTHGPAAMKPLADAIKNSTYVELEGAAHLTAMERAKEWADAVSQLLSSLE